MKSVDDKSFDDKPKASGKPEAAQSPAAQSPAAQSPIPPNIDREDSLGKQHPSAPFSLMTFTYPLIVIFAVFCLALFNWIW